MIMISSIISLLYVAVCVIYFIVNRYRIGTYEKEPSPDSDDYHEITLIWIIGESIFWPIALLSDFIDWINRGKGLSL